MRPTALIVAFSFAIAAQPAFANEVCKPEVHRAGKFDLRQIGPLIEGVWTEEAIGAKPVMGVQHDLMEITYDRNRNRLYLGGGGGAMTELVPVRGGNKPLRYDFVKGQKMDKKFHMMVPEPFEWALVQDCQINSAPQFEWQFGSGSRQSQGIISFFSEREAMGTKRNSAYGVREQVISR